MIFQYHGGEPAVLLLDLVAAAVLALYRGLLFGFFHGQKDDKVSLAVPSGVLAGRHGAHYRQAGDAFSIARPWPWDPVAVPGATKNHGKLSRGFLVIVGSRTRPVEPAFSAVP